MSHEALQLSPLNRVSPTHVALALGDKFEITGPQPLGVQDKLPTHCPLAPQEYFVDVEAVVMYPLLQAAVQEPVG